ncbi:proline-rich protein 29-like [Trichomycterus rosablanca]|uniref:proline-rich protein 29-like n=1 Tax=Trichomycterus rosablanca TaxID=2290929 RepID=UPI002F353322
MEQAARLQQGSSSHAQFVQQPVPPPVTLFQQLPPSTVVPSVPSLRPGHIKEDLVELMMMQNAQMHQVIMNNMTMSALSSFGYTHAHEANLPVTSEEVPEVYHHHYPCAPCGSYPMWMPMSLGYCPFPLQTVESFQHPLYHSYPVHGGNTDSSTVPPKLPPSVTGTVGPDVPPTAEHNNAEHKGTEMN